MHMVNFKSDTRMFWTLWKNFTRWEHIHVRVLKLISILLYPYDDSIKFAFINIFLWLPGQHPVEQHVCLFLLVSELSGPLTHQLLQVASILLHHLQHIVHHAVTSARCWTCGYVDEVDVTCFALPVSPSWPNDMRRIYATVYRCHPPPILYITLHVFTLFSYVLLDNELAYPGCPCLSRDIKDKFQFWWIFFILHFQWYNYQYGWLIAGSWITVIKLFWLKVLVIELENNCSITFSITAL